MKKYYLQSIYSTSFFSNHFSFSKLQILKHQPIINIQNYYQSAMSISCQPDGSCPFLYQCVQIKQKLSCQHNSVFPLTPYQYGIFSVFPICSAICNLSGNSFGEFKVLMLMDILNYQENEATVLTYPLITGTALFNFFDLIFKRHPSRNTSLIDYNVVLIIIPNILFGSTIGSLVNKFIPPIVADSIIIPIMTGFSIKFFLRFLNFRKQEKQEKQKNNQKFLESDKTVQIQLNNENQLTTKSQYKEQFENTATPIKYEKSLSIPSQSIQTQFVKTSPEQQAELAKQEQYQASMHLPHIFATIFIFIIFQTLSFLVQGKIIRFSICSVQYPIGLSILTVLFLLYDFVTFRYTKKKLNYYKQIGYQYNVKLNLPKNFLLICVGAFIGGFNGGVFGIGNSTTVIFTLLFMDMEPAVVSATVGYQVVFSGSASLAQAFATNQIQLNVVLLFFLQTFIIGGILSFIAKRIVSRFSQIKVNQCLMLVVFGLVTSSVIALIISVVLGYKQFGPANMQDVPFHC